MEKPLRQRHFSHAKLAWLKILLLNAQGADKHNTQIEHILSKIKQKPKIIGVSETHFRFKDTTDPAPITDYTWRGKASHNVSRGTGFWIHDSISAMCDIVADQGLKHVHPDIHWIYMSTATTTIYFAIVYSHPKDPVNHKAILNSLSKNITHLSNKGRVIIMGDFNARCPTITGDIGTNTYTQPMLDFITNNNMQVLSNSQQIAKGQHLSFQGPIGASAPDYIMTPRGHIGPYQYKVANHLHFGSWHKPIQASFMFPEVTTETWGELTHSKTEWDDKSIIKYNNKLKELLPRVHTQAEIKTKHQIDTYADQIIAAIRKATELISTKTKGTKRKFDNNVNDKGVNRIRQLNQAKQSLLNDVSKQKDRVERKRIWAEARKIQARINATSHSVKKGIQEKFWIEMANKEKEDAAGLMWKQLSRARQAKNTVFPGQVRRPDGSMATGSTQVLDEIKNFYTRIANNEDKAAQKYYKPGPRHDHQQEQKETDTKTALNKTKSKNGNRKPDYNSPCDKRPTSKEIEKAVIDANKQSAPGRDTVQTKAITHGYETLRLHLDALFGAMWEQSHTPAKWQEAITKLLHKKGPITDIGNYRPITLLSTLFKIWERILNNRLTIILDTNKAMSPLQSGSRANFSAAWTIVVRKILTTDTLKAEPKKDVFVLQVDLNKAYNRVNRDILWTILWNMGIKGLLWKAIISTYSSISEVIRIGKKDSDTLQLRKGLRQGSVLSPSLFTIYVNPLIDRLNKTNTGLPTGLTKPFPSLISVLMYVDDLQAFSTSIKDACIQMKEIMEYANIHEAVINFKKSNILSSIEEKDLEALLQKIDITLTQETKAVHLGSMFTLKQKRGPGGRDDIKYRIKKAHIMSSVMKSLGFCITERADLALTAKLLTALLITTITHGITTVTASDNDLQLLDNALIPQIEGALNIKITPNNIQWAYREMDLIPPSQVVKINDATLFCRAINNDVNPLYNEVINNNQQLEHTTRKLLIRTKTKFSSVTGPKINGKTVMRKLKAALIDALILEAIPDEPNNAIYNEGPGPCTQEVELDQKYHKSFTRLRSICAFPPTNQEICFLCNSGEPHTPLHCISTCTHSTILNKRNKLKTKMDLINTDLGTTIDELETEELSAIMGQQGYPPEILQALTEAAIILTRTSPILDI